MYYDNEDAGDLGISGAAGASEARNEEQEEEPKCNGLHRFGFCKTGEHDSRFVDDDGDTSRCSSCGKIKPVDDLVDVVNTGERLCVACRAKETTSYFCSKCGAKRTVPVEQDNVECQNCGRSLAGLDGEDDN